MLLKTAATIRRANWLVQQKAGITHVPSNDFSLYDQVLDTSVMLGAVPERFGHEGGLVSLNTYFAMARGTIGDDETTSIPAMDMT
jgi:5-methyltetrahydropteroyltriglutamate--homocysteine methyltransferase